MHYAQFYTISILCLTSIYDFYFENVNDDDDEDAKDNLAIWQS